MFNIKREEVNINLDNRLRMALQIGHRGIKVNPGKINLIVGNAVKEMERLRIEIRDYSGVENPNSPKQVCEYLEGLQDPLVNATCTRKEKGKLKWSSAEENLQVLSDNGYEFADLMMEYRKNAGIKKVMNNIVSCIDEDNMVHPKAALGVTNRIQWSDPGIMSVHKEYLWDIIEPLSEGEELWSIDIKNEEPQIIANWHNVDEMVYATRDNFYERMLDSLMGNRVKAKIRDFVVSRIVTPEELMAMKIDKEYYEDTDVRLNGYLIDGVRVLSAETQVYVYDGREPITSVMHDTVEVRTEAGLREVKVHWLPSTLKEDGKGGREIEGILDLVPVISDGYRREFKTCWNSLSYGGSKEGLRRGKFQVVDPDKAYEAFYSMKNMKRYIDSCKESAKQGVVKTKTYFGVPLAVEWSKSEKERARCLMNYPVQGTGADILELLMLRAQEFGIRVYFPRHDELIVVCKAGEYTENVLRDIFEFKIDDWNSFSVHIKRVR
jgi:hypothetical protein